MSDQRQRKMFQRIGVAIVEDFGDDARLGMRCAWLICYPVARLRALSLALSQWEREKSRRTTAPKQLYGFDATSNFFQLADTTPEFLALFNQSRDKRRRVFTSSTEQFSHVTRGPVRFAIVSQRAHAGHELNSRQAFGALPASHCNHADFAG